MVSGTPPILLLLPGYRRRVRPVRRSVRLFRVENSRNTDAESQHSAEVVAPGASDHECVAGFLDVGEEQRSVGGEGRTGHFGVDVAP